MAKKEIINAPKIASTYSNTTAHAVKANGFVFVTGQVANRPGEDSRAGTDGSGEMGTLEEQITRVMDNVAAILEEAGTDFGHVVKRNVYLAAQSDFTAVYRVMERYFVSPVASTGVIAGLVPASSRVEVEVVAVMPD